MDILITGVNGFIGLNLSQHLAARGHRVYGTARRIEVNSIAGVIQFYDLKVGAPAKVEAFYGRNLIIHLIHDFTPGGGEDLVKWYQEIERTANSTSARQIYISSYSARSDAISEYGRTKYQIEQYFIRQGHSIVRPGLVIGDGGIFRNIYRVLQKFPVIPVPGPAYGEVPFISIGMLCKCLCNIAEYSEQQEYNLFAEEFITLPIMLKICSDVGC